jgi:peptidoglycan/LPS O-acetylase OafA/YrhL
MAMRLPNRILDTLDTLFHMLVARDCRKFGEGDIGLSERLASDWRVNNFDLLRLLAALQVAVVHSIGILKPTGYFARLLGAGLDRFPGVPIFFVISGVLISKSYEHSDSLRDYLRNRCLRIFPGLWVCLVVSVAVILALGVGSLGRITAPDWLLWWAGQMSIFQNLQATFLEPLSTGLNGSLWTIPIELEFYIVLPALYGILRLRRRLGNMRLLAIALASLAVQLLIVNSHRSVGQVRAYSLLEVTLAPYLWMFLVGVSIQRNWSTVRGWLFGRAHWWGLGYLMLCAAARWLRVDTGGNNMSPVYLLPLAGLIVSLAMSAPQLSDRILRHHDVSYGLYLYHMLVIDLLVAPSGWASFAAAIIVSFGLAALSWILIEKPYLRGKRGALRAVSDGSSVSAAYARRS